MDIAQIIEKLGGSAAVGRICGVTHQAVLQWRRVPAEHVITIARGAPIAITPHEMRADIYPHPLDGTRHARTPRKVRKTNGKRAQRPR